MLAVSPAGQRERTATRPQVHGCLPRPRATMAVNGCLIGIGDGRYFILSSEHPQPVSRHFCHRTTEQEALLCTTSAHVSARLDRGSKQFTLPRIGVQPQGSVGIPILSPEKASGRSFCARRTNSDSPTSNTSRV
jgi:hypothetical protein